MELHSARKGVVSSSAQEMQRGEELCRDSVELLPFRCASLDNQSFYPRSQPLPCYEIQYKHSSHAMLSREKLRRSALIGRSDRRSHVASRGAFLRMLDKASSTSTHGRCAEHDITDLYT